MHVLEQYIDGTWVLLAKTDNEKDIKDLCKFFDKLLPHDIVLTFFMSSSEVVSTFRKHGPIRLRKIGGA